MYYLNYIYLSIYLNGSTKKIFNLCQRNYFLLIYLLEMNFPFFIIIFIYKKDNLFLNFKFLLFLNIFFILFYHKIKKNFYSFK